MIAGGLWLAVAPLWLAAASVVGVAFALAVLVRPVIGLWVLPLAVPFGSIRELPVAGLSIRATDGLVGLTLVAWLVQGVAHRRLQIKAPPLLVPLLLLLGAMLLSATGMYALPPTVKELAKWGEILLVYVLVFNLVEDRRAGLVLIGALFLAGSLSALHGVAGALLRIGPPQFAILGGRVYRAFGTFGQPNPFGGYMNHTLPIAVSLLGAVLISRRWDPAGSGRTASFNLRSSISSFLLVLALLSVTGILTAGLGLSWSRGAWLGAAAGLATVGGVWLIALLTNPSSNLVSRHLRQRAATLLWVVIIAAIIFLVLGGFSLLPAPFTARLNSALATFTTLDVRGAEITHANFATLERVAHWQAAWGMWRAHFWTGVGIGNYEAAYPEYRLPKWPDALGHAHNIYFNMAAEVGFVGLIMYLLFISAAMGHTWRVAQRVSEPAIRGFAIGALGVLVALAVHNLFDNLYVHDMGIHLALILGLASAFGSPRSACRHSVL